MQNGLGKRVTLPGSELAGRTSRHQERACEEDPADSYEVARLAGSVPQGVQRVPLSLLIRSFAFPRVWWYSGNRKKKSDGLSSFDPHRYRLPRL